MFRGLYTAVSSMQTNQKMMDISSNNMANVNTTGFKKDLLVSEGFRETYIQKINGDLPTNSMDIDGAVEVNRDGDGFQLATARGFFTVESPRGTSYSRQLKFAIDEDGFLRTYGRDRKGNIDTSEGNFVLDGTGSRVAVEGTNINVNEAGQVELGNGEFIDLIHTPSMNTIGTINGGRRFERTHVNFMQGQITETGNNLDIAIDGYGFFKVDTPEGEMYTRNGNFTLNADNMLVTSEGYAVLGQNGPITINDSSFGLNENGQIIENGQITDAIDITDILNTRDLDKHGLSYYVPREALEAEEAPFEGKLIQGFLEGSNINAIDEMVNMITTMRAYENSGKAVQAYDDIMQKAVNEVGRL